MTSITYCQDFTSPISHPIKLSGSFGELRSNHFHAGIDIKSSNGKSGDKILAAADGHVSRIKISNTGYGKCLYIDHPNGYTTVYAHLSSFTPELEKVITEKQKIVENYEVEIYFKSPIYSFKQGQVIGKMGNTGRSYGPHLHFEIRDTYTEVPMNPFLFGIKPEDTRKPIITGVNIVELTHDYQIIDRKPINITNTKGNYSLEDRKDIQSDYVAISIKGFDRMNGSYNKNGIYSISLYVDNILSYQYTTNAISFTNNKHINAHIDYEHKQAKKGTYTNCLILPGDKLDIYDRSLGQGIIYLTNTKQIKIEARDFNNNLTTLDFNISRDQSTNDFTKSYHKIIKQGVEETINIGSSTIQFPYNSLAKDLYLNYKEQSIDQTIIYQIGNKETPLLKPIQFKTPISNFTNQQDKIALLYLDKDTPEAYPVNIENNILSASLDKLGKYKIVIDTIPPSIKEIPTKSKNILYFKVKNQFEIQKFSHFKYKVFIENQWIPARWNTMKDRLEVYIKSYPKGKYNLKIEASDQNNNNTVFRKIFTKQ